MSKALAEQALKEQETIRQAQQNLTNNLDATNDQGHPAPHQDTDQPNSAEQAEPNMEGRLRRFQQTVEQANKRLKKLDEQIST